MWHKPCRTFHPWCPCIKTRCLFRCDSTMNFKWLNTIYWLIFVRIAQWNMGERGWFGTLPGSSYHCMSLCFQSISPGLITLSPESIRHIKNATNLSFLHMASSWCYLMTATWITVGLSQHLCLEMLNEIIWVGMVRQRTMRGRSVHEPPANHHLWRKSGVGLSSFLSSDNLFNTWCKMKVLVSVSLYRYF